MTTRAERKYNLRFIRHQIWIIESGIDKAYNTYRAKRDYHESNLTTVNDYYCHLEPLYREDYNAYIKNEEESFRNTRRPTFSDGWWSCPAFIRPSIREYLHIANVVTNEQIKELECNERRCYQFMRDAQDDYLELEKANEERLNKWYKLLKETKKQQRQHTRRTI